MNESIRTLVFVGVGAVIALGAYASRPREEPQGPNSDPVSRSLFPDFKDPLLAKSLQIKQFDEATARVSSFEVQQQQSGIWTIPSHGNYPADAESQLKAVAESLVDLKILDVMNENSTDPKADNVKFGVVNPDDADVGAAGVGTLITVQDGKGNDAVNLIVGKSDVDSQNVRFVRKPKEDLIYAVTIDLTKLPTEFDKWIEKDLLKLSTFDVNKVHVKDYLVLPTQTGQMRLVQRMDALFSYASDKSEWKLDDMATFRGAQRSASALTDFEEVNKDKLNELRNGLGDLKIVDVRRKPEGLGNSLKVSSEKLPTDQQRALTDLGFYPYSTPDGKLEIFGANGELVVDTKDGVQYVLRFGEIAPEISTGVKKADKDAKEKSAADDDIKVHRYLFVTTQVAPSVLVPPELEPEPVGPEPAAEGAKKDEAAKADAKAGDDKKGEEKKDEQAATVDPQQAERERIKKENERKLNAYRDQKTKAESRVKELNARFADWYYVVAEDVYKKIHLVRSDVVKEKSTAKEEGFDVDAFRKLEDEGLKVTPKP